jgi:hypothetical protein
VDKTKENKRILFLFVKMILLFGVSYLLYKQLTAIPKENWLKLELKHPLMLFISCILIFANWGFEWKKWITTLQLIETNTSRKTNFKAFMAGIATGLVTPNMIGNFIGRMYYFKKEIRGSVVSLTLLSNFSQFFASILFGTLSILILKENPFELNLKFVQLSLIFFCVFMLIFYFFFEKLKWKFLFRKKHYSEVVRIIKKDKVFRWKIIIYSLLRHFIFTLQFWLMFNAFEDALNFDTFFWIWQIFLWTTLVPSLWFGKLIIRESIALFILGSVGFGEVEILTASVLIWVINLALPSLFSLFICKQNKVEIE